jgi:outer membrane protein assembly factor BamA
VDFRNNTIIATPLLRNAIAGTAVGVIYEEQRFRQILDASIKPLYEARGRLRVAFPKISTQPVPDVNGLKVTVDVNEGDSYNFGELTLQASTAVPRGELLRVANIEKGDLANIESVNSGLEQMKGVMRKKGYLKATATAERKIDDQKKIVDLVVRVEPGKQYTFASLDIKGLDILTEPFVRKMWAEKPGQPFNPDYPDYFLQGVRDEGILDNLGKTRSEAKINEETGNVDVILYFTGEPTRTKKKSPGSQ